MSVLEFPDMQHARDWYNSLGYKEAIAVPCKSR